MSNPASPSTAPSRPATASAAPVAPPSNTLTNTPTNAAPHTRRPACLSLIAAVSRNQGIGLNNQLLVHLPQDLRHFRRVTMGCPVIMGRKTWDSLPAAFRPLPGRTNIVLSRDAKTLCPGATVCTTLNAALAVVQDAPRVFVIGGAQVYAMALPMADELVLTEIDADLPADAFFPPWDRAEFECIERHTADEADKGANPPPYAFVTYRRLPPKA